MISNSGSGMVIEQQQHDVIIDQSMDIRISTIHGIIDHPPHDQELNVIHHDVPNTAIITSPSTHTSPQSGHIQSPKLIIGLANYISDANWIITVIAWSNQALEMMMMWVV